MCSLTSSSYPPSINQRLKYTSEKYWLFFKNQIKKDIIKNSLEDQENTVGFGYRSKIVILLSFYLTWSDDKWLFLRIREHEIYFLNFGNELFCGRSDLLGPQITVVDMVYIY